MTAADRSMAGRAVARSGTIAAMIEPRPAGPAPTVPVATLQGLVAHLAAEGHPVDEVLAAAGIEPARLDDPEGRIAGPLALTLWQEAERLTGDADLGLHVAEAHHQPMGVFDYALRAADTLGAAWTRACDYYRLIDGTAGLDLSCSGGTARLRLSLPIPLPRAIPELVLASFVLRGRESTGCDWAPRRVTFAHAEPADVRSHRRVFRCPIEFLAPGYLLEVGGGVLELRQPAADAGLSQVLDRYASELIARLPCEDRFADRVRAEVTRRLRSGDPGAEAVAKQLGVSARTLHRRLREEGTSHRSLVDEVRHQLALRHLDEGRLSLGELAFTLGYSETSAFHRAFRRWQGCSPSDYLRRR